MVSNTKRKRMTLAAIELAQLMPICYSVFYFLGDIETINYILALLSNKVQRPKLHGLNCIIFKVHQWETLDRAVSAFMSLQFQSDISFNRYRDVINASDMTLQNDVSLGENPIFEAMIKYLQNEKDIDKTIAALMILVNRGADVNKICNLKKANWIYREYTPLEYAALQGNINIVKYLVEHGANVNPYSVVINWNEMTPLMHAAKKGDIIIVKYLVENGADVNTYSHRNDATALSLALQFSKSNDIADIVKYLVEKGADVNTYSDDGLNATPWMYAVKIGRIDIVKYLVTRLQDTNIDINAPTPSDRLGQMQSEKPETLSLFAVIESNDNLNMIKYLVSIGAKFHIGSALERAANYGHLELIEYLVNENDGILNEGIPNCCDDDSDDDSDVEYYRREERMRKLYRGEELAVKYGEKALLLAAKGGYIQVVKYLINHSVNMNTRNYVGGLPPLSLAVYNRHGDVVRYLAALGATHVKDTNSHTPLMYAIMQNDLNMAKCLVENDANMYTITTEWKTIYVLAQKHSPDIFKYLEPIYNKALNIVKCLVENGANMYIITRDMDTIFIFAGSLGNSKIFKYLEMVGIIEYGHVDR